MQNSYACGEVARALIDFSVQAGISQQICDT